jgi:hypothetical protein
MTATAQATPGLERLWAQLGAVREHLRLVEHPYITALRAGALSKADLQIFATENDHVVVATAVLARRIAVLATGLLDDRCDVIAAETHADVERWRGFSIAAGWCHSSQWCYGADPFDETIACAGQLAGSRRDSLGLCLARLYAVITAQHDAALAQLIALQEHYSMDGSATAWLAKRARDEDLIRLLEAAIGRQTHVEDPLLIVAAARATYQSLWTFHDGVWANRVSGGWAGT